MLQANARLGALAAMLLLSVIPAHAADWQPVSSDDLQMKREPKAPNAAAIYLYRQVDRDDDASGELIYSRIKILTEEGRKHANIELPYLKGATGIRALQARVIHADGSIVEFDGTVYDKPLVKARGVRMMAKSFTLPNVEVGSIIEYRYRRSMPQGWAFDSRWLLSDDLFTRHGVFSLRPAQGLLLRWSWPLGLPPDTQPPAEVRGVVRMETHDVPAFVSEECRESPSSTPEAAAVTAGMLGFTNCPARSAPPTSRSPSNSRRTLDRTSPTSPRTRRAP